MIFIASDHAAVELKQEVRDALTAAGREVRDLGTEGSSSVDYPDFAHHLASEVLAFKDSMGILICGTGIGMSMAANRHPGIRAALCHDAFTAEMARRHNNANVLCCGSRVTGPGVVLQMVEVFLTTPFDGDRHQRRVHKIEISAEER